MRYAPLVPAVLLLGVSHGALAQAILPDVVVEAPRTAPVTAQDSNRWVIVDRAFSPSLSCAKRKSAALVPPASVIC